MLGRVADAEDVAQQAFVDAFRALGRFRSYGRTHAFSTWLTSIAVNRCKDVLKSKKRTEAPLEIEVVASAAAFAHDTQDPETRLLQEQRRSALAAALIRVPIKYREILVLKDVEGFSYDEIQLILGLPVTTLKIRVVRARRMMRSRLRAQGVVDDSAGLVLT
jgi:RNA polymerase sigma-70 factor (ECF subfamily)